MKCAMARPHAVVLHRGALYVSDSENHCIRVVQVGGGPYCRPASAVQDL